MMAGEGGQDRDSIFIRDQLEGVCKALRRPVKFRAKLPVLFAIRLDLPVQTWRLLRVPADKEFALQIGHAHACGGPKPVLLRKDNVTTHLCQLSRVKFAG